MDACGSHESLISCLEQFRAPLVRRALYLTKNHDDALDLVQDTFERALRASATFATKDDGGRRWLETTLKNLFIDRWRQKQSRPALLRVVDDNLPAAEREVRPPWIEMTGPDVVAAASDLPEPLRSMFRLHHFGGIGYVELGRRFHMPLGTVGTRLYRARRRLRRLLLIKATQELGPELRGRDDLNVTA